MSQLKLIEASTNQDCAKPTAQNAFTIAIKRLKFALKNTAALLDIKESLSSAGFSQNGRNRIMHLSEEEVDVLCSHAPEEGYLWSVYVHEIQLVLSKMDQARRKESYLGRPPFIGRPYVSLHLAATIGKLACLRYLVKNGIEFITAPEIRSFLLNEIMPGHFVDFHMGTQQIENGDANQGGRPISIRSCIRFLELYCDELITPPCLASMRIYDNYNIIDDYDPNLNKADDLNMVDDGEDSYLATVQDIPSSTLYDETYYEALPKLHSVLDWFLATHPVMDSNQIKRGWPYVQKSSKEWHQQFWNYETYEMLRLYSSWNCLVKDRHTEWLNFFPSENPFRIVPLTTSKQLQAESVTMRHCVVTYIERCANGGTRIFSVLDARNNQPVATAELSKQLEQWNLVQLTGKYNKDLMHRTKFSKDPLTIALSVLVKWYNENTPKS